MKTEDRRQGDRGWEIGRETEDRWMGDMKTDVLKGHKEDPPLLKCRKIFVASPLTKSHL